jgi:threonine/homoserine/homoserine lactone efflux protein
LNDDSVIVIDFSGNFINFNVIYLRTFITETNAMIEAIITGLTLGLLLAISIGPIIFAIIKQSLNNGYKGGLLFVAGVSSSDIIIVTVCNLLTSFFNQALKHQTAIGVCGSAFLLVIGIYTLFFKKVMMDDSGALVEKVFSTKQRIGIFFSGFLMNMLNPGVLIFWLAATAKIHSQIEDQLHPIRFLITVYVVCLLFVLVTDIAKVLLAGKIRPRLTPHNLHIINKISGIILVVFAITLAWGTLHYKVMGH